MDLHDLEIYKQIKQDELELREFQADLEAQIKGISTIAVHSDTKTTEVILEIK